MNEEEPTYVNRTDVGTRERSDARGMPRGHHLPGNARLAAREQARDNQRASSCVRGSLCVGPLGTPTELPSGQTDFDFSAFAVAQSEPGFARFGCKASIFSYRPQRRGSGCHDSVQVTDVTSGFPDVARRTIGVKNALASYQRLRTQNLDLIECGEPLARAFSSHSAR